MCCNRRARSRRTWTGSIGEPAVRLKQSQNCHRKVPNEKRSVAPAIVPSRSYVGRMGSLMQATVRGSTREKNCCTASEQQSTVKITGDGAVALKLAADPKSLLVVAAATGVPS